MIKSEKYALRKAFMKKILFILVVMLLATGLIFTGCGSTGGGKSSGPVSASSAEALTMPFRHLLGMNSASNWNATNVNQAPLGSILEYTYSFVTDRKNTEYLDYFFLEKREVGAIQLRIKSITIIADREQIPLNLRNIETETAFGDYPIAPVEYDRDTLIVNYPLLPGARLAVIIPSHRKDVIAKANTVSVKIVLD
jgi:hypothetical protein